MENQTEKKPKHLISLLVLFALIGFMFLFLFRGYSFAKIFQIVKRANPAYLLLALGMMFLYVSCEAYNIFSITGALKQTLPFKRCLQYAFVGFYFCAITPSSTGGQPAQVYYMKKDGVNISYSSLTLLIVILVYQVCMLLYGAAMLLTHFSFLAKKITPIRPFLIYGMGIGILFSILILCIIFSKKLVYAIVRFFVRFFTKVRLIKDPLRAENRVTEQIDEYERGVRYLKTNPMLLLRIVLATFVQLTAFFLVPFFVYRSFGMRHYGVYDFLSMQVLLHLSVCSLPLPGAVGASENAFMRVYRSILPERMVMPSLVLSRGISFYSFLVISGIVTIFTHVRTHRPPKQLTAAQKTPNPTANNQPKG